MRQEGLYGQFIRAKGAGLIENVCSLSYCLCIIGVGSLRALQWLAKMEMGQSCTANNALCNTEYGLVLLGLSNSAVGHVVDWTSPLMAHNSNIETCLLCVASLNGWLYMLFFAMGFRDTGPFICMMGCMLCAFCPPLTSTYSFP